jgi:hypothetical protein
MFQKYSGREHQYINIMINQVPGKGNRMMYTSMVYIWYNCALQGAIFLPNTLKFNKMQHLRIEQIYMPNIHKNKKSLSILLINVDSSIP